MESNGIYISKRLANLFERVISNKITLISAPAGYGKTTLARYWTQTSEITSHWLTITDSLNCPDLLQNSIDDTVQKNKDNKLVFVIDQFDLINDQKSLVNLFEFLIQTPNDVTFILLSRYNCVSRKNLSYYQNDIFLIQENEIKLNTEEVNTWLSTQSCITLELSKQDKNDIYTLTEGCPALMHLALKLYQHHENPSIIDECGRVAPTIENYVLNNWLYTLPQDKLYDIHPLTIPPYLSIELAIQLQLKNVDELFLLLENHLLLKKQNINGRWIHQFHPLVRAVIHERYSTKKPSKSELELIALFLEKEGLFEEALKISLETSNLKLVFRLMKKFAPTALQYQNYTILKHFFNKFNLEDIKTDHDIHRLSDWVDKGVSGYSIHEENVLRSYKTTDQWVPFISLNTGSLPFICTPFGYEGDINKIKDHYSELDFTNDKDAFLPFRKLALAEAMYEQNDLVNAKHTAEIAWLQKGVDKHPGFAIPALWLELLCQQIDGNTKNVHFLAEEIFHRSHLTSIPVWRRIGEAVMTYVLIQDGHLYDAEEWISKQKQLVAEEWNEWTSFEYFMFARALLAVQNVEEAGNLLKRMITSTSIEKNHGVLLKRRILQAIVASKLDQQEDAHHYIREALELGNKYGYARAFLDEDVVLFLPMQAIQHQLPKKLFDYSEKLIKWADLESNNQIKINPKLKDSLTLREIEVIKLIKLGLSNQKIGEQMNITEGTVKGHLHRIYRKLNVKNRTQAIKVAESELLF